MLKSNLNILEKLLLDFFLNKNDKSNGYSRVHNSIENWLNT